MRALAYFNDARGAWSADARTFEALIGRSGRDIRARGDYSHSAATGCRLWALDHLERDPVRIDKIDRPAVLVRPGCGADRLRLERHACCRQVAIRTPQI